MSGAFWTDEALKQLIDAAVAAAEQRGRETALREAADAAAAYAVEDPEQGPYVSDDWLRERANREAS